MNNIYYELNKQAKNNQVFTDLFSKIISDENILLAYQNIKNNIQYYTSGIDKVTIKDINKLSKNELLTIMRQKIIYLKSNILQQKQIHNKELYIPTIFDKIIQQCFKQVLEPICEARFSSHSYGNRPGRSYENAIADIYNKINTIQLYYVISFNIYDLYKNINHSKLIKQLWTLGIRDTKVIYRIKTILKNKIQNKQQIIQPKQGIIQSGILSNLLLNIALNEFDQWVEQRFEYFPTEYQYTTKGARIRALKKESKLKEMYIIRYAEHIRIFCRTLDQAKRTKMAIMNWFKKRFKYIITDKQIFIINLKKKYDVFLGFKYKILQRKKKYIVKSEIDNFNISKIQLKLKKQIINIQHAKFSIGQAIYVYNKTIEKIHNYYQFATCVSINLKQIDFIIKRIIKNRLRPTKNGKCISQKYKNSKQIRYIANMPIYPLSYIQFKIPIIKKLNYNYYEHENKNERYNLILYSLLSEKLYNRSMEYMYNRIEVYKKQKGLCYITGKQLDLDEIHCHHIIPKRNNGTDEIKNLVIIHKDIHKLIHMTNKQLIQDMIKNISEEINWNKLNKLRKLIHNDIIKI